MSDAPERIWVDGCADYSWFPDDGIDIYETDTLYIRADLYESLQRENVLLRDALKDEILAAYDHLSITRRARYAGPEEYFEAVIRDLLNTGGEG